MSYTCFMDTHELDTKMVDEVLAQAGLVGWGEVNLVEAAREAGLDLGEVRARFPGRTAVLLRFGSLMDQVALDAVPRSGLPREKLFDLVMSRFDQMQRQRAGVLSVMSALRFDPGMAMLLGGSTMRSMKWLLEAAGVPASGIVGMLRVHGLLAVWTYALRAWEKDESADLGATMAAVDRALDRAVQAEAMLPGGRASRADDAATGGSSAEASSGGNLQAPPMMPGTSIVDADDGPAVL